MLVYDLLLLCCLLYMLLPPAKPAPAKTGGVSDAGLRCFPMLLVVSLLWYAAKVVSFPSQPATTVYR